MQFGLEVLANMLVEFLGFAYLLHLLLELLSELLVGKGLDFPTV